MGQTANKNKGGGTRSWGCFAVRKRLTCDARFTINSFNRINNVDQTCLAIFYTYLYFLTFLNISNIEEIFVLNLSLMDLKPYPDVAI